MFYGGRSAGLNLEEVLFGERFHSDLYEHTVLEYALASVCEAKVDIVRSLDRLFVT